MSVPAPVYTTDVAELCAADLGGFFVDWPVRPSPERHLEILRGSDYAVLARSSDNGRVVGFVTAISDGVLERIHPAARGAARVARARYRRASSSAGSWRELEDFYMVDLVCDPEL